MRLPDFDFHVPTSLEEVFDLLDEHAGAAMLMAGGTDVLPSLKLGRRTCSHLIWLKRVPGLDGLAYDDTEGLNIGATALLEDVRVFPATREHYVALSDAIRDLATPQTRAKGTVVGNICNASPCADTATPLLVYGARVRISSRRGTRDVPLEDFFRGPRRTALELGDIVERILVPKPAPGERAVFLKFSPRSKVDIAAVNVSVGIRLVGGIIERARVFLGTVAPTPVRAPRTEAVLAGARPDLRLFERASGTAREECAPITDHRATKEYKTHMVGVLVRRALERLVVQA
ncbi:MAG: xanthine dehydrogenase family protein subunit M [Acidobacteriota bacterium]